MRVGIIGAGFAGLACCWHLLKAIPTASLTLFDSKAIGNSASGIAAGLLHPHAGAHAKRNWAGIEGIAATSQLLDAAKEALGEPVSDDTGILRLAVTAQQQKDFQDAATRYPEEVRWCEIEECQKLIPHTGNFPGVVIKPGLLIHCRCYLQGLWKACAARGAQLEQSLIKNLADLKDFDRIIVAAGAHTAAFSELAHLRLTLSKGQLLQLSWPQNIQPLAMPISSHGYLTMDPNRTACFAGSTYERNFQDEAPDLKQALALIRPKAEKLFPPLCDFEVIGCQAGIRVSTPDHLPIYGSITERIWYITGMGSKGLLYHALFAQKLINEMMK